MKFDTTPVSQEQLAEVQALGFLNGVKLQDAPAGFSPANVNMPAGILSQVSVNVVENILQYRAGDEALGGRQKLLDFYQQEYYIPLVERLGSSVPYNDYDDAISAGINLSFDKTGHYRFSNNIVVGELEEAQLSAANVNARDYITSASAEALMIEFNRVAFNGYVDNAGKNLVYGLLNNPSLNTYENSSKKFSEMTWEEVITFFSNAMAKIRTQSGNNIQRGSKLRAIVSAKAFDYLRLKYTNLGVNVLTEIQRSMETIGVEFKIISAIELDNANANQDVIYFILENNLGGVSDTTTLGYSEIARMGNVVVGSSYTMQKMSVGTTGAVVFKPAFVVRYTNI